MPVLTALTITALTAAVAITGVAATFVWQLLSGIRAATDDPTD